MNLLTDRVIVISGAGGGIGTRTAEAALARGASVIAFDLPSQGLDALGSNDGVTVVEGDVTNPADWDSARDAALDTAGRLDGLVNNAGIEGAITPMLEYPDEMFDRVIDVNVKGVWLGIKHLAPTMVEQGSGAIVNLSSVAGLGGAPNLSAYSASKHAVIGLSKTAALELGPSGVRSNAICPSPINTRMMRSLEDSMKSDDVDLETLQQLIASNIPLGRYGEPTEVADLICFLLSDDARFLSGAVIPIDGAMKAR